MPKQLIEWTDEQVVLGLIEACLDGYRGQAETLQIELMRRLGHPEYEVPKENPYD